VDLVIGSAGHKIVESLFLGLDEDDSVSAGLEVLEREERTLVRSTGGYFDYRRDIAALIELNGRVFARYGLPDLLATYKILSVEQEKPIILTDDIIMEIRADGELEDIETSERMVFSLKTCTDYADWLVLRDRIALQNYTEPFAYNADGIQMCYIIKGGKGEDFPFQYNNTLYPWHKDGQYSWNWKYVGNDGEGKALGGTWKKIRIWQHMDIKKWLDYIQHISGPSALMPYHRVPPWSRLLRIPVATRRHPAEIRAVIDSLQIREREWFKRLALVEENDIASLERHFPREFTDCAGLKGTCAYYNTCISNMTPMQMVEAGFQPRTPHHSIELAQRGTNDSTSKGDTDSNNSSDTVLGNS
jgi:hypothetical protein